jgi:UDP-2,3-diacylglucosamine pyrophosphatase LpxH
MKRIIISDLHIGTVFYNESELLSFLSQIECDQLILAGDIVDMIRVPMFTARAAKIFSIIGAKTDVIYIVGNHDTSLSGFIGEQLGSISFVGKYEFNEGGRLFRIEHGDQYDKGLIHSDFWMKFMSLFHDWLERSFGWDLTSWYVSYRIKKRKLRRIWDILKWNDDVDVIIMGHSHCPECIIWVDDEQNIKTYVNCGDWVSHTSYVEINDGIVRLKKYEQ